VNNSAKVSQDIVVTFDVAEDIQVMADSVELSRVLNNVLENSRRYGKSTIYPTHMQNHAHILPYIETPSSEEDAWSPTRLFEEPIDIAQVHIETKIQGDWVVIAIKDNGNGVSPDALTQLKNPFFRANEARTNTTGTGLGLAIVEKAIQSMQGKLTLSNWGFQPKTEETRFERAANEDGGFMVEISLKRSPHKLIA
jgi:two-component system osmolarity sensor histidine kinase EnvZ